MWQCVICNVCHAVNVVADTSVHLEVVPLLGNSHFHADDHNTCSGLMTMTFVVGLCHSDQLLQRFWLLVANCKSSDPGSTQENKTAQI